MISWQVFMVGVILGVIQFGFGLWIGKIVYDRRKQRQAGSLAKSEYGDLQESTQQLKDVTSRIRSTVGRITSDVSHHQIRIEQVTRELNSMKNRSVSITEEVLWERLNQMLRMTTDFSRRLTDAEKQLKSQQHQIDTLGDPNRALGSMPLPGETEDLTSYSTHDGAGMPEAQARKGLSAVAVGTTCEIVEKSSFEEPDDVDAVLESVRSRLNEVVQSTTVD